MEDGVRQSNAPSLADPLSVGIDLVWRQTPSQPGQRDARSVLLGQIFLQLELRLKLCSSFRREIEQLAN
jgi:hypothetical protein